MGAFIALGLFQGAVYGLLAVGIVLVYKAKRVFNFAQGEFGSVAAFSAFYLVVALGLPYWVGVVGGLVAAVGTGLIVERVIVRPLESASRTIMLVALVGVALFTIAITVLIAEPIPRVMPPLIGGSGVNILGAGILPQQLILLAVLAVLAAAMAWFFKTDLGLAVLASSQDIRAAQVVGISPVAISRLVWGMAALLGGVAGLLYAPVGIFTPGFMTLTMLVPAFAAAVLGGMTSLPGAFVGGISIGIVQNLGIYLLGQQLAVPGAAELGVFALLMLVLLIRPQGLLGKEA
ncbi:branched-chain amino acid ABC transporter permease [Glycomyces buryatensis]|uniref:Branched-chain amino acid ABC transporter permease n=1 Tax=Glycomyces buryatensis TaxID=2570927 RepID=A0A4V4HRU2_9ACTN|nr:branched-chain amino acid ABC transporter permease [Glycomyces buryatensis]THV38696.1 branched-chain amino acid ABC transporter permease [Glycomyces buryatensis]